MVRFTKKKKGFLFSLNELTDGRIHFKVLSSPRFYNESIDYNFPEDKKQALRDARIFTSKFELGA